MAVASEFVPQIFVLEEPLIPSFVVALADIVALRTAARAPNLHVPQRLSIFGVHRTWVSHDSLPDFETDTNFSRALFARALEVTLIATLHAPHQGRVILGEPCLAPVGVSVQVPHFETALTQVARHATLRAHVHCRLVALAGLVSDAIALEAEFLRALK